MKNGIKYVHTNLIAMDWKYLAKFYIDVFGCKPIYPERNLSGKRLDDITQLKALEAFQICSRNDPLRKYS